MLGSSTVACSPKDGGGASEKNGVVAEVGGDTVIESDVLIIGAGPAGLAAATACLSRNATAIVVDSGSPVDKRGGSCRVR